MHVPYRDSKLTRLLQGCLGGGARTAVGNNISNIFFVTFCWLMLFQCAVFGGYSRDTLRSFSNVFYV